MLLTRLQRGWYVVPTELGVELRAVVRAYRCQIHGDTHRLQSMFSTLSKGVRTETLAADLANTSRLPYKEVERVLAFLREKHALVDFNTENIEQAISDPEGLYSRQITFFEFFESSNASGADMNKRLQSSRVLIAGLGGYGTPAVMMLTRMGVRTIVGVDHDVVELSNLRAHP